VQWFLSTKYDHARNPVDRNDPSFEELVGVFRGRRCRDPRDKVHALQGLLNESQSVEIDYGKPIRDVILDAGRVIMEASSNSIWFYPHVENHYEDLCYELCIHMLGNIRDVMDTCTDLGLSESFLKQKPNRHNLHEQEELESVPEGGEIQTNAGRQH
jgi:hypothetical protein